MRWKKRLKKSREEGKAAHGKASNREKHSAPCGGKIAHRSPEIVKVREGERKKERGKGHQ